MSGRLFNQLTVQLGLQLTMAQHFGKQRLGMANMPITHGCVNNRPGEGTYHLQRHEQFTIQYIKKLTHFGPRNHQTLFTKCHKLKFASTFLTYFQLTHFGHILKHTSNVFLGPRSWTIPVNPLWLRHILTVTVASKVLVKCRVMQIYYI